MTESGSTSLGKDPEIRTSNFDQLIASLTTRSEADPELVRRLLAVSELTSAPLDSSRLFLTVLLRTQGKRLETLKDSLLCLSAQTDRDFEVVVLEHNATPADGEGVKQILSRLEPEFASRVRLIEVNDGSRAKPLNLGVAAAEGRYLVAYDDDDLVFANWVEEFRRSAELSHGRLLRSLVAVQEVRSEGWPLGSAGFRTSSWPAAEYSPKFSQTDHLKVNHSPFMSIAFPRSLFALYGLRFDEELAVCEDWDLILQGSLLCGVHDVPALTAIYRRWGQGVSSYTTHSSKDWRTSEQRVIDRVNSSVVLLGQGELGPLRDILILRETQNAYAFLFKGNRLRWPLHFAWRVMAPFARFAVRGRNAWRRRRQA